MKFTPQACRTVTVPVARCSHWHDERSAGSYESEDPLWHRFEETVPALEIRPDARLVAARWERSTEFSQPFRTSVEWLISAAALAWAVLGILNL